MAAKKRTPALDTEIGSLYSLPLAEFIPARNALAGRLRREGDREASERVKGLVKPSASAWAVNVLFRDEQERMAALLAAGEQARRALSHALTHGAAEALRDALQEERKLRDDLRRRAVALLAEGGGEPGRAIVDRITVDLEALALSPTAAEAAERGWLDRDLDPPGFEVLAGLQIGARSAVKHGGLRLVPAPEKKEEKKKEEAKREEKRKEKKPEPEASRETAVAAKQREREEREAKVERERREREETKIRERLARAEDKVAKAAEEADSLRGEAERAERTAAEAERAAEEAGRRAEAARETAGHARTRADRAAEQLARAEADLEAVR
jgi:hypothetical protein